MLLYTPALGPKDSNLPSLPFPQRMPHNPRPVHSNPVIRKLIEFPHPCPRTPASQLWYKAYLPRKSVEYRYIRHPIPHSSPIPISATRPSSRPSPSSPIRPIHSAPSPSSSRPSRQESEIPIIPSHFFRSRSCVDDSYEDRRKRGWIWKQKQG